MSPFYDSKGIEFSRNSVSYWETTTAMPTKVNTLSPTSNAFSAGYDNERIKEIILQANETIRFYSEHERSLRALTLLRDGWDSYDAPKPNELAFQKAKEILIRLSKFKYRPTKIMPSVDGGICFLFVKGDKYADLDCDNEGDILASLSDRVNEPEIWEITDNKVQIDRSIKKIITFLK